MPERGLHLAGPALQIELHGMVHLDRELLVCQRVLDVDRLGLGGPGEPMLGEDVAGDGEQIGLRAANPIVAVDAQESQENFLGQIRDIGGVSKSSREIAAKLAPLTADYLADERLAWIGWHGCA